MIIIESKIIAAFVNLEELSEKTKLVTGIRVKKSITNMRQILTWNKR